MRDPIPEIFFAAHLLDRAVGAHLAGDYDAVDRLIRQADLHEVREWTESLWGSENKQYHRYRKIEGAPAKQAGLEDRMPRVAEKRELIKKYGSNCVFCGIPVISKEVRTRIRRNYPGSLYWSSSGNAYQHAAFQCMWLQYDHIIPHARGGDNSFGNIVIACGPCNFGRGSRTLEEVGVSDPRSLPVHKTSWDGLERFPKALPRV